MAGQEEIVMFDSTKAARFQTNISGWVSRQGHFWGNDERAARYDGCTHVRCEDCGKPVERGWLICPQCREVRQVKKYKALPREKWNGEDGLYSDAFDKYFWSWDDVENYCEEEMLDIKDLRLVICEPCYLPLLDGDYGCDELPEDGELPDKVIQAIENFNKVIKEIGVVSWIPGNKTVDKKLGEK